MSKYCCDTEHFGKEKGSHISLPFSEKRSATCEDCINMKNCMDDIHVFGYPFEVADTCEHFEDSRKKNETEVEPNDNL